MAIHTDVRRAAKQLDQMAASGRHEWLVDWHNKVDLDTLLMYSTDKCLLGQLHNGDFGAGRQKVDEFHGRLNVPYVFGNHAEDWTELILELRAANDKLTTDSKWSVMSGGKRHDATILRTFDQDGVRLVAYRWEDTNDFSLRTRASFEETFKPYVKPDEFKHGDVMISPEGKLYLIDKNLRAWSLDTDGTMRWTSETSSLKRVTAGHPRDITFNIITRK